SSILSLSCIQVIISTLPTRRSSDLGENNFIGCIMWNSTKSVTNTALISVGHTYNLVFSKNRSYFKEHRSHFRLAESGDGFSNSRSEEHTSELQSPENLVCRLLLEKK